MKDKINPLTNAGECSDKTYKSAVEKRNRENFFHAFCRRILKLANKHLGEKQYTHYKNSVLGHGK